MNSVEVLRSRNEAGEIVKVDYDDQPAVELAVNRAIKMAEAALPSGTVFEIRGKVRPDDPIFRIKYNTRRTRDELAKAWSIAWYWTSTDARGCLDGLSQEPLFRHPVWAAEKGPFGGYILIARLRTA